MSKKLLIDFDIHTVTVLMQGALALNSNFSLRPNFLLRPNKDNTWSIVGLGDSNGGAHYYPVTTCPNCGIIKSMNPVANEERQLYEIHCGQCGDFCNYLSIYTPLPETIDPIINTIMTQELNG